MSSASSSDSIMFDNSTTTSAPAGDSMASTTAADSVVTVVTDSNLQPDTNTVNLVTSESNVRSNGALSTVVTATAETVVTEKQNLILNQNEIQNDNPNPNDILEEGSHKKPPGPSVAGPEGPGGSEDDDEDVDDDDLDDEFPDDLDVVPDLIAKGNKSNGKIRVTTQTGSSSSSVPSNQKNIPTSNVAGVTGRRAKLAELLLQKYDDSDEENDPDYNSELDSEDDDDDEDDYDDDADLDLAHDENVVLGGHAGGGGGKSLKRQTTTGNIDRPNVNTNGTNHSNANGPTVSQQSKILNLNDPALAELLNKEDAEAEDYNPTADDEDDDFSNDETNLMNGVGQGSFQKDSSIPMSFADPDTGFNVNDPEFDNENLNSTDDLSNSDGNNYSDDDDDSTESSYDYQDGPLPSLHKIIHKNKSPLEMSDQNLLDQQDEADLREALLARDGIGRTSIHLSLMLGRPKMLQEIINLIPDQPTKARMLKQTFRPKSKDSLPPILLALSSAGFCGWEGVSADCIKILLREAGNVGDFYVQKRNQLAKWLVECSSSSNDSNSKAVFVKNAFGKVSDSAESNNMVIDSTPGPAQSQSPDESDIKSDKKVQPVSLKSSPKVSPSQNSIVNGDQNEIQDDITGKSVVTGLAASSSGDSTDDKPTISREKLLISPTKAQRVDRKLLNSISSFDQLLQTANKNAQSATFAATQLDGRSASLWGKKRFEQFLNSTTDDEIVRESLSARKFVAQIKAYGINSITHLNIPDLLDEAKEIVSYIESVEKKIKSGSNTTVQTADLTTAAASADVKECSIQVDSSKTESKTDDIDHFDLSTFPSHLSLTSRFDTGRCPDFYRYVPYGELRDEIMMATDRYGRTALHIAADMGVSSICRLLLTGGLEEELSSEEQNLITHDIDTKLSISALSLDPMSFDEESLLPIHYAVDSHCEQTLDLLLAYTPKEIFHHSKDIKSMDQMMEAMIDNAAAAMVKGVTTQDKLQLGTAAASSSAASSSDSNALIKSLPNSPSKKYKSANSNSNVSENNDMDLDGQGNEKDDDDNDSQLDDDEEDLDEEQFLDVHKISAAHPAFRCIEKCAFVSLKRMKEMRLLVDSSLDTDTEISKGDDNANGPNDNVTKDIPEEKDSWKIHADDSGPGTGTESINESGNSNVEKGPLTSQYKPTPLELKLLNYAEEYGIREKVEQIFSTTKMLKDDDEVAKLIVKIKRGQSSTAPYENFNSMTVSNKGSTSNSMIIPRNNKTALITHRNCFGHGQIPDDDIHLHYDCDDPSLRYRIINGTLENPHRLEVLVAEPPIGCLRTREFIGAGNTSNKPTVGSSYNETTNTSSVISRSPHTMWKADSCDAPLVDILRVHELSYISNLENIVQKCSIQTYHSQIEIMAKKSSASASLIGTQYGSSSTTHNPHTNMNPGFDPSVACQKRLTLDKGDTKVTRFSYDAAKAAAGCVLDAVDLVVSGQVNNAFCAVRPPGHHMGPRGAVDSSDLADDPEGSQGFCLLNNIAIGAAYAKCNWRNVIKKVAIIDFDIHHGNGTEAVVRNVNRTPNGGRERFGRFQSFTDVHGNVFRYQAKTHPCYKPWLDKNSDCDEIFFASIHGYGGGFYPGSGQSEHAKKTRYCPEIINIGVKVGDRGCNSESFRQQVSTELIPKLLKFNPDLLFISAGFDGHSDDLIGQCHYKDDDFSWITQELLSVANICCNGKVVSVLEGGYNTRAGYLSPFARCVRQHVRVLMNHDTAIKPDRLMLQIPGERERRRYEAYLIERQRQKEMEKQGITQKRDATSAGIGSGSPETKRGKWWTENLPESATGGEAEGW